MAGHRDVPIDLTGSPSPEPPPDAALSGIGPLNTGSHRVGIKQEDNTAETRDAAFPSQPSNQAGAATHMNIKQEPVSDSTTHIKIKQEADSKHDNQLPKVPLCSASHGKIADIQVKKEGDSGQQPIAQVVKKSLLAAADKSDAEEELINQQQEGCGSDKDETEDAKGEPDNDYQWEGDSNQEEDDSEHDEEYLPDNGPQITSEDDQAKDTDASQEGNTKKTRKKPAKTTREFWTRWKAETNSFSSIGGEKRKYPDDNSKRKGKAAKTQATEVEGNDTAPLICMEPIIADKQASQFAQIRAQIAGADTRRASTQRRDLTKAVKSFGNRKVKAVNGNWLIKPMITPLKNFQITITSWMCQREVCFEPPGGVLADDMGTGKTLMTLGLISAHPPDEHDKEQYSSATLIIVPNHSSADQWRKEVRAHCGTEIAKSVTIYDGKNEDLKDELQEKSVVITTFWEIGRQYPSKTEIKEFNKQHKDDPLAVEKKIDEKKGVLYQIPWYRVVLDEAQSIKGRITQCSLSTAELEAKYRWCLSGTPLSNNPGEYFPYLRFIRFPYTGDWKTFKKRYIKDYEGDALDNFESMVSWVMIRRRKNDAFLGKRLFELPDKTKENIYVPLSVEEAIIERHLIKHFENANAEGDREPDETAGSAAGDEKGEEEQTPSVGITLATSVSHPFNLENMLRANFSYKEVSDLKMELSLHGGKQPLLTQILESSQCSSNFGNFEIGIKKLRSFNIEAFGGLFTMDTILQRVLNEAKLRDVSCPVCERDPINPRAGPNCDHMYCSDCFMNELNRAIHTRDPEPPCKALDCTKSILSDGTPYGPLPHVTITGAVDEARKRKWNEPGKDLLKSRLCNKPNKNGFFTVAVNHQPDIPPSAKLTTAMTLILQWQADYPEDKIIVFTQYIMTAKCLGRMLEQAKIGFVYFYGEVPQGKKKKAITAFKERADAKVMLIGLRAGGTSLNLTVANRVILIDPWWNDKAEEQAFGRIERYGQLKTMHMVRIFTRSEVDGVIEGMQISKASKVAYALQDDGHKPVQLSDDKLKILFADPDEGKKRRVTKSTKPSTKPSTPTSGPGKQKGASKLGKGSTQSN